jgi:hypothetical protein
MPALGMKSSKSSAKGAMSRLSPVTYIGDDGRVYDTDCGHLGGSGVFSASGKAAKSSKASATKGAGAGM